MKTYMAHADNVVRKWFVVDAEGMVLGRLASKVAAILRGKNKPTFTPNVDTGDFVIVLNCDKVVLTFFLSLEFLLRFRLFQGFP